MWLAVEAAKQLEGSGLGARVVSLPAAQLFLAQEAGRVESVLGPRHRRITIEAGATDYWQRVTAGGGLAIGVDRFGESAPYAALQEHFGLTPSRVAARVKEWAGS